MRPPRGGVRRARPRPRLRRLQAVPVSVTSTTLREVRPQQGVVVVWVHYHARAEKGVTGWTVVWGIWKGTNHNRTGH